jgi:YfiH family protein
MGVAVLEERRVAGVRSRPVLGIAGRLERFVDEGLVGYRSPSLAALGVPHVFTTRHGGASELDLGDLGEESLARLVRAAGALLSPRTRVVSLKQVHGDCVFEARRAEPREPPCADALVSELPDRLLLVRTADCVPVLIARADGRRVAAVHAGWRGLVGGVIPRALEALGPRGTGEPVAAIGPCLSVERFEVGPEVAEAFERAGLGAAVVARAGRRPHVDLVRAAQLQLARGGVGEIDASDRCTWNDADFFSYRRDVTHGSLGTTGRQGAAIAARSG